MKLTNYIRDAFIKAAMDDVPSVDYDAQAQKLIQDDIHEQVPVEVKKLWKKYPEWFSNDVRSVETPGHLRNVQPLLWKPGYSNKPSPSPEVQAAVRDLAAKHEAQRIERNALRDRLHGIAYSVATHKALVELLPEFKKYLPADEPQAARQLPAVAGVVADFVKAGWPKDKKGSK